MPRTIRFRKLTQFDLNDDKVFEEVLYFMRRDPLNWSIHNVLVMKKTNLLNQKIELYYSKFLDCTYFVGRTSNGIAW